MAAPTTNRVDSADRPLRPKRAERPFPLNVYQTAVGKKWVMAVTGIMLLGFVLFHMLGNLKLYLGVVTHNGAPAYDVNIYAEWLRDLLVPFLPRTVTLWLLRLGLFLYDHLAHRELLPGSAGLRLAGHPLGAPTT